MSSDTDDLPTMADGPRARGADTFLDEPPAARSDASSSDVAGVPDVDATPRGLSPMTFAERYRTRRELGAGGMGVVNLCVDRQIGREVAVKVMLEDTATKAVARDRFLREARVQAQLEHPGVVPVYEIGVTPEGHPYFSMKRVHGTTLLAALRAVREGNPDAIERYPRRKRLRVVERVCETMAYAHSRGVVHRDLKPANVMLGDFGEVSVLDWGIAKLRTDTDLSDPSTGEDDLIPEYTAPGSVVGTAGYMAPEQTTGQDVDARADVYVLGAMLFEAIALTPLHRGSGDERMRSTLQGVSGRPSEHTDEEVPPELDEICHRATRFHPKERYADAGELLAALRRFLDGARITELRREVAGQHAAAARLSLQNVKSASETTRVAALRELGAAAALDPDNQEMVKMIEALLEPEPSEGELPSEVIEELERGRQGLASTAAGRSALAYSTALLSLPIFLWMGVRHWPTLYTFAGLLAVSAVGAFIMWRLRRATGGIALAAVPFAFVPLGVLSSVFGPFFLVPALCATTAIAFMISVHASWRLRGVINASASLTVLVPFTLAELGVIPRSYRFVDGALRLTPNLVELPEVPTTVLLLFASLFVVLIPSALVGRAVEELRRAERRRVVQAHRLRSMLPKAA